MSNHDAKHSGCCGGSAKPATQDKQQPAQADTEAQESITPAPLKPITMQPKSKSCCG